MQSLYSKLPYDPVKDFTPVTKLVTANLMLVTRRLSASSFKEFIEYARPTRQLCTVRWVRARESPAMSWLTA